MSKLTAEQLQTALVIASMEYYKKYVQGDDEGASKLESAKAELAVLENVLQIAEATEAFKYLKFGEMCLIKQLRINSDMPKPLVKQLVEYFSRFPFTYGHITQGWDYMRAIGQKEHQDDLIFRSCRYVTASDWFIAAPVADVPENVRIELYSKAEEDRRRRLEDPIVFKITPAGVVIVSMWGEEAKAEIFDKYR